MANPTRSIQISRRVGQIRHRLQQSPTFDALRNRDFRWFWIGRVAVSAGFQMSAVAQGWLVYELTGSALALGWVGTGRSVAMFLLSPFGGVLCDRTDKRSVLLWTRAAVILNSLLITILIATGSIQVWHLAASALLSGIFYSFMMPAQQTIIADMVDRETMLNAVSLNSIGMGLTGIFAASIAGVLVELIGVAGVYLLMVAFQMFALFAVSRLPKLGASQASYHSPWLDLTEGLRYTIREPMLLTLLGVVIIRVLFLMPYRTFMPKFSKEVMGFEAAGLGVLMAAPGAGSLISSLAVASLGDFRRKGRLLLAAGVAGGIALILFANVPFFPLTLLSLALLGGMSNACMVTNNTLLQINSATQYRGRVMSIYMMLWGLTPLGTLPAGALADQFGIPIVITFQGASVILIFLALVTLTPRIRRL